LASTGYTFDAGNGTCATGSCLTALSCGRPAPLSASPIEFTSDRDFNDGSLVDVFNNRLVLFVVFRPTMFFHDVHGALGCSR